MTEFAPAVIEAVLAHMNDDHSDDSLRIVQAFGSPDATAAVMSGLDGDAGFWTATVGGADEDLRIPWPAAPISERGEIRREVVALHDQARATLGFGSSGH